MFSGGKIGSGFFPPVYYTFFETKLVANSIKLQVRKAKKKRTALKKGKKKKLQLLIFCGDANLPLHHKDFELYFYGCWWEVSLFLLCIKENNLSSEEKTKSAYANIFFK